MAAELRQLDFIARLADAWDCRGNHVFRASGVENRALCALAGLPEALADIRWEQLLGEHRQRLLFASRSAIEFGRQCAWVWGEGQGARL